MLIKNKLLLSVILLSVITNACSMQEKPLSLQEATKLYLNTTRGTKDIPYSEYRKNMMQVVPVIEETQDIYHNALSRAVEACDFQFAKSLLDHGADPNFRDATGTCAYDYIDDNPYCKNNASEFDFPKNPDVTPKVLRDLLDSYEK
jgi:hypothetical protein